MPAHRPLSVTILAFLYIAVGALGLVYHFPNVRATPAFSREDIWIELTELAALLSGLFMLRAANWARWLAAAWIAFHVILSAFDALRGLLVHCLLCALITWLLFRSGANRYFRRSLAASVV